MRDSAGVLTTRDVILEMRADLKKVADDVGGIKTEQARVAAHLQAEQNTGTERRQRMVEVQATMNRRNDITDGKVAELETFRNEAAGAIKLAKWAMGTSLLASLLLILQFATNMKL